MKFRALITLVAVCLSIAAPAAHAGPYGEVARGLSLFDVQLSGEKNLLGDGWTINAAANYNNRKFDFGVADLTLTGAIRAQAGYTMRGIPAANFQLSSGLLNQPSPLTYDFNLFNGIQNVQSSGSALININTKINALGFYQESVQISNRGSFDINGLVNETGTTDYDIGPINVQGSIIADALIAITQPFYNAQGIENPFAQFSPKAAKAAELLGKVDGLRDRMAAGEKLTSKEIGELVNNSIMAAILGGKPDPHMFDDFVIPSDIYEAGVVPLEGVASEARPVPEPATLGLLLLGSLPLVLRRRTR